MIVTVTKDGLAATLAYYHQKLAAEILENNILGHIDKAKTEKALVELAKYYDKLACIITSNSSFDDKSLTRLYSAITAITTQAFMVGAHASLTKSARDAALTPVRSGASRGGAITGAAKKREADEWRKLAKEIAAQILKKNDLLTQDDLAERLSKRWPSSQNGRPSPRLPHHNTVVGYISELQNSGELPRRRKKAR